LPFSRVTDSKQMHLFTPPPMNPGEFFGLFPFFGALRILKNLVTRPMRILALLSAELPPSALPGDLSRAACLIRFLASLSHAIMNGLECPPGPLLLISFHPPHSYVAAVSLLSSQFFFLNVKRRGETPLFVSSWNRTLKPLSLGLDPRFDSLKRLFRTGPKAPWSRSFFDPLLRLPSTRCCGSLVSGSVGFSEVPAGVL